MIIVSQDKKEIVNFDSVISIKFYHDDEYIEYLYEIYVAVKAPDDNYILLGIYETEERAKEVLQEIITVYTSDGIVESEGYVCYEMPEK